MIIFFSDAEKIFEYHSSREKNIYISNEDEIYVKCKELGNDEDCFLIYYLSGKNKLEIEKIPFSFPSLLRKFKFLNSALSSFKTRIHLFEEKRAIIEILSTLDEEILFSPSKEGNDIYFQNKLFERISIKFSSYPKKSFVELNYGNERKVFIDFYLEKVEGSIDLIRKKSGWYLQKEKERLESTLFSTHPFFHFILKKIILQKYK